MPDQCGRSKGGSRPPSSPGWLPAINKPLTSRRNFLLSNSANHLNMPHVVNQPKGGDPVSHCLQPRVIDRAWVIVPAKDLRLQRRVLRMTRGRERHRVEPLLHAAANELLKKIGDRNVVFEDLSSDTREADAREKEPRRETKAFRMDPGGVPANRIVKSPTRVVHVNPRGTSSECPRCGGRLDHPEVEKVGVW